MRYAIPPARPGLIAIAAILALSSTPSFAQAADPAPATPAVVTPPPVITPPAVTSSSAAPDATTSAPTSGGLVTVPIRPGSVTIQPSSAPALNLETEDAPATVPAARSTASSATRSTQAPRVAAAPRQAAPAPTPPVTVERTASTAPATATPPIVAPEPAPAPSAQTPAPALASDNSDDILPIAGAAGAAILLLGGGLYAASRRRRPTEQVYVADTIDAPVAPVAHVAPVMAREVQDAPVRAAATPTVMAPAMAHAEQPMAYPRRDAIHQSDAPFNRLPPGFDTSRFGRHVQAAYRGPTADNPFLSLKRRVKRASFYDMRERMAADGRDMAAAPAAPAAQASAQAPRQTDYVTTRLKRPPMPGFRPAYSS